jgi:hypothetical protein
MIAWFGRHLCGQLRKLTQMNHSIKSLALSHVRSDGPVSMVSVEAYVRSQFGGSPSIDDLFSAVAGLIQAEAVDLCDDDEGYLAVGPRAREEAYRLDVAEGRGFITPNGPQVSRALECADA